MALDELFGRSKTAVQKNRAEDGFESVRKGRGTFASAVRLPRRG